MLNRDTSLMAEWDAATGFDIHDRNMIWSNYCYFASKDDKEGMDREERIMRSILAKIKLGEPVRLREARMDFIRSEIVRKTPQTSDKGLKGTDEEIQMRCEE